MAKLSIALAALVVGSASAFSMTMNAREFIVSVGRSVGGIDRRHQM